MRQDSSKFLLQQGRFLIQMNISQGCECFGDHGENIAVWSGKINREWGFVSHKIAPLLVIVEMPLVPLTRKKSIWCPKKQHQREVRA